MSGVSTAVGLAPRATPVVGDVEQFDRWNAFVAQQADASTYHDAAWLGVVSRAFGHPTVALEATENGVVTGVLPLVAFAHPLFGRFLVSMPFFNYGGVLASTPDATRALLEAAVARAKAMGASHVELRHRRQLFDDLPCKTHKVAMRLELEDSTERQWNALDRKLRNQIRKADKNDLVVERGGPELLSAFYRVFARNMRDLGTPVYASTLFEEVLRTFPDTTRIICVRKGAEPIAASLVVCHRDTVEVPWASSLREFNPLCANVRLYWEMLQFAVERGARVFDFGRSSPHEGTYQFKAQWGARPEQLFWEYALLGGGALPDLSPKNRKFQLLIAAWQRLPVWAATWLGPHIVRHIP